MGIDAIVPGIIITSVISLVISLIFSRKVKISSVNISYKTAVSEVKR